MPPSNVAIKADADVGARRDRLPLHGPDLDHAELRRHHDRREPGHALQLELERPSRSRAASEPASRFPRAACSTCRTCRRARRDPNYTAACRTATQLEGTATISHPLGYPQRYDSDHLRLQERRRLPEGDAQGPSHHRGGQQHRRDRQRDVLDRHGRQRPAGPGREQLRRDLPPDRRRRLAARTDQDGNQVNGYYNLDLPGCIHGVPQPDDPGRHPVGRALLPRAELRVRRGQPRERSRSTARSRRSTAGSSGTINTSGYGKNYNYDNRLKYQSPPHFLTPIAAAWQIVTWVEQKAACAYNATTTC